MLSSMPGHRPTHPIPLSLFAFLNRLVSHTVLRMGLGLAEVPSRFLVKVVLLVQLEAYSFIFSYVMGEKDTKENIPPSSTPGEASALHNKQLRHQNKQETYTGKLCTIRFGCPLLYLSYKTHFLLVFQPCREGLDNARLAVRRAKGSASSLN